MRPGVHVGEDAPVLSEPLVWSIVSMRRKVRRRCGHDQSVGKVDRNYRLSKANASIDWRLAEGGPSRGPRLTMSSSDTAFDRVR